MRFVPILIAMLALASVFFGAEAQSKRAFVVGVGDYDQLTDLKKTVGDADGYEKLFRDELGFTVTRLTGEQRRRDFIAAFDAFVNSVSPGDEVAFVFSGHGWSDGSDNYLSLSDAPRGVSEAVLKAETIALERMVMARLRERGPKLNFAIIDACRDEKYGSLTKSSATLEKGIVRISAAEGELILYSAGAGQTSLDRLSDDDPSPYSVFTRALLPRLSDVSQPLARIADETRKEVQRLAGSIDHRQRPEMMLGIGLDFCLSGDCADERALDEDSRVWLAITSGQRTPASCEDYRAYLARFPNGKYAMRARGLLGVAPCATGDFEDRADQAVAEAPPSRPGDVLDARTTPATTRAPVISGDPSDLPDFALFRECEVCPEMVVLPAGEFLMGSPQSEFGRFSNEGPQQSVSIRRFAIARFETTWAEWERCVEEGLCAQAPVDGVGGDRGWGRERRPVMNVSWTAANTYAEFASEQADRAYRLPTEAEWEYAARGNTTSRFSWGEGEPNCEPDARSGANNNNCPDDRTHPVGTYRPNPYGLFDVHGNVWEWVEDCWVRLASQPSDGAVKTTPGCNQRVYRGGSWGEPAGGLRSAVRGWGPERQQSWRIGFRLARTL